LIFSGEDVPRSLSPPPALRQGRGFDIVDSLINGDNDGSTLQAYDVDGSTLGKLPAGSFTGECGAADVIANGRRLLVTEQIKTVPAAGINQATYSLALTGWDATTGAQVWSATPVTPSSSVPTTRTTSANPTRQR
jgi:hypothetical protein